MIFIRSSVLIDRFPPESLSCCQFRFLRSHADQLHSILPVDSLRLALTARASFCLCYKCCDKLAYECSWWPLVMSQRPRCHRMPLVRIKCPGWCAQLWHQGTPIQRDPLQEIRNSWTQNHQELVTGLNGHWRDRPSHSFPIFLFVIIPSVNLVCGHVINLSLSHAMPTQSENPPHWHSKSPYELKGKLMLCSQQTIASPRLDLPEYLVLFSLDLWSSFRPFYRSILPVPHDII